jgi:hypothetical protein
MLESESIWKWVMPVLYVTACASHTANSLPTMSAEYVMLLRYFGVKASVYVIHQAKMANGRNS